MMLRMFQPGSMQRVFALAKMYENANSTVTTSFNNQSQILLLQKSLMGEKSIFCTLSEVDDFEDNIQDCKESYSYIYDRKER